MKITQITITEENLLETVKKQNVYGICKSWSGYVRIEPIVECEIGDILSGKCAVIEIEES